LAEQLANIAESAAKHFGGKPTRPETIHLTLAFLGNVPEARLPELGALGKRLVAPAFDLHLDRLGFWQHNRLLWAGAAALPPLAALAAALQRQLLEAGFCPANAGRVFFPHVTLIRKVPAGSTPDLGQVVLPEFLPWTCREFVLVRSRLSTVGAAYGEIGRFPLAD
jgi:2'-5' RNA ligase